MSKRLRKPLLHGLYQQYLADQNSGALTSATSEHYSIGTLERLAAFGDRMTRRAAVLALGLVADYESNAALGRALLDSDRGVRMLAENSIRAVWFRVGTKNHRWRLEAVAKLNAANRFAQAIEQANKLIEQAPWVAEGWNQRAVALLGAGRFAESIRDCEQTLEINPYHFGAAAGMGQCHLKLGNHKAALACLRRALELNPNLEGVRAQVLYLQRSLKSQE
jgi:tetratricopeptide (TPR) repeat protein